MNTKTRKTVMQSQAFDDPPGVRCLSLPVAAYDVKVYFHRYMEDADTSGDLGCADWDAKEIHIVTHKEGKRRTFESIFACLLHELNHTWSLACGHRVYDAKEEEGEEHDAKERAVDAMANLMAQSMLQGGMAAKEFLDRVRELVDNVE